jgi:hypothetical protein
MRKSSIGALLFALAICVAPVSATAAQRSRGNNVVERRVAPASANSKISSWTEDHYVWTRRDSAPSGTIMLLLAGSNGAPRNFRIIGAVAAERGYRTIGLMYPDDVAVVAACRLDREDRCMERMRDEIVRGSNRSPHVSVDRDNSIDGRFADLIKYLAARYPDEGWNDFLAADGLPRWDKIAVGGLSQGGGHAAYIAKVRRVPRVVMFGSPADGHQPRGGRAAPWMQLGATPSDRYYGFRHARDQFSVAIDANWKALRLESFGKAVDVTERITDFAGSHMFVTDMLPATGRYEQAHPSVFSDGATPKRADGRPVFEELWSYLLGTP